MQPVLARYPARAPLLARNEKQKPPGTYPSLLPSTTVHYFSFHSSSLLSLLSFYFSPVHRNSRFLFLSPRLFPSPSVFSFHFSLSVRPCSISLYSFLVLVPRFAFCHSSFTFFLSFFFPFVRNARASSNHPPLLFLCYSRFLLLSVLVSLGSRFSVCRVFNLDGSLSLSLIGGHNHWSSFWREPRSTGVVTRRARPTGNIRV